MSNKNLKIYKVDDDSFVGIKFENEKKKKNQFIVNYTIPKLNRELKLYSLYVTFKMYKFYI